MTEDIAATPFQPAVRRQEPAREGMDTVTGGKAKKRIQNRVAQRSYRQRMKARVEELQAKVDVFEGGRQHGQSPPMTAQSNSQSPPNASNAALCVTQQRPDEVRSSELLQQISPALRPTPNASHHSTSANSHISTTSRVAPHSLDHAPQPPNQTTGFDLLGSSHAPNDMQLDLSGGVQLDQLSLKASSESSHYFPDCFNYAAGSGQQAGAPGFMDDVVSQLLSTITLPNVTPLSNSKPVSPPSGSSLSSDLMSSLSDVRFPQGSWTSEIEQAQSELDNAKNPEAGADTEMSLQHSSAQSSADATLEDRIIQVAEQAKHAGFEDLDAFVAAYQMSTAGENSDSPVDPAWPSLRRLPRLIATMRHAAREWKDWERRGFPLD